MTIGNRRSILNKLPFDREKDDSQLSFFAFLNLPGINRFLGRLLFSGIGFILVSIVFRIMVGETELGDIVKLYSNSMLLWGLGSAIVGGTVGFILYRRMIDKQHSIGQGNDE